MFSLMVYNVFITIQDNKQFPCPRGNIARYIGRPGGFGGYPRTLLALVLLYNGVRFPP